MPALSQAESDDAFDVAMMRRALDLARQAASLGEVPVGAIVVRDRTILAEAFNRRESLHDPTAHAERLALTLAGKVVRDWRLDGCTLYVTLEPCVMCAGALVLSRVRRLVYGTPDSKAGACESLYRLAGDRRLNHRLTIQSGLLKEDCGVLLSEFFRARRPDQLES